MKHKILITNDDGVHAPGIRYLYEAVHDIADVLVIAPSDEKSASALSITIRHPLSVRKISWDDARSPEVWSVSGTPADCVKLGLTQYTSHPPDLIISGVNAGANSGKNLLYSGTVGGAIEGVLRQIPGIAFSAYSEHQPLFEPSVPYIRKIVELMLEDPMPIGTLLNVNFPERNVYRGVKMTRQGSGMWVSNPDKRLHPTKGHNYYWMTAQEYRNEEPEDSDTYWLEQGFVTCVPVHVAELTDHRMLSRRREGFENAFDLISEESLDDEMSLESLS